MKKFCESLREHLENINDFDKKKMLLLTKKRIKITLRCFCGKRILKRLAKSKYYWKFRDHCHYTGKYRNAAHSICNLRLNVPNEISEVLTTDQTMILILS